MVNHATMDETAKITDLIWHVHLRVLLSLYSFGTWTTMDREERLRRRREQYRVRWNRNCRREQRLEARRACERCRHAMMSTEQYKCCCSGEGKLQRTESIAENQPLEISSFVHVIVICRFQLRLTDR